MATEKDIRKRIEALQEEAEANRQIFELDNRRTKALKASQQTVEEILTLEKELTSLYPDISKTLTDIGKKQRLNKATGKDNFGLQNNVFGALTEQAQATQKLIENDQIQTSLATKLNDIGGDIASGAYDLIGIKASQKDLDDEITKAKDAENYALVENLKGYKDTLAAESKRIRVNKGVEKGMSVVDKLSGGMVSKAKGFTNVLGKGGPILIGIGALLGVVFKLLKFSSDITDKLGQSFGVIGTQSSGFKTDMQNASIEVISLGKSTADVVEVVSQLSSEFGIGLNNAVGMSEKILDTAVATGLATGEATKLFGVLMSIGDKSAETAESFIENTYQLAAQNKVNPSAVLKDMADSSELIALHGADNLDSIRNAAIQARKLGLNLKTVEKISDSLLNFQSSLTSEFEAEVLIGKNLELGRARQLALTGDMEGMTKEILKNVGSEAEFNKLNVFQRRALAKAVGMEANELAKMVRNQDKTISKAKSFTDLLGDDGMSALTNIMNQFKEMGATIMLELGQPLEKALMDIKENFFTPENIEKIKNGLRGIVGFIKSIASVIYHIAKGIHDFATFFTGGKSFDEKFANFSGEAENQSIMGTTSVNDVKSSGGSHLIATPSGEMLETHPRDTVFATTTKVNDFISLPMGGISGDNTLVKKLIEQNDRIITNLERLPRKLSEGILESGR